MTVIAIIGAGNVGSALGTNWAKSGHEIIYGVSNPKDPKHSEVLAAANGKATVSSGPEAVKNAEVVVIATPWSATQQIISTLGDFTDKIVMDCTNPLGMIDGQLSLVVGLSTSGGEQVSQWCKGGHVFKAVNQVGFDIMKNPNFGPMRAALFVAGPDGPQKQVVINLCRDLWFDVFDAGGIDKSRLLEPLAMLWIHMSLNRNFGRDWAFGILRR